MKLIRATYTDLLRAPPGRVVFTGAANRGQAATDVTVYTLTGRVELFAMSPPFVTEVLVSTSNLGTISVGTASQPVWLVGTTTVGAGTFALNNWWTMTSTLQLGTGVDLVRGANAGSAGTAMPISEDIIIRCLTQNTTDGQLDFDGLWYRPLTAGAGLALGSGMT